MSMSIEEAKLRVAQEDWAAAMEDWAQAQADIRIAIREHIGVFDTFEEAHAARAAKIRELK